MALPSGYKQLEYAQSSGTQYIDTKVTGKTGVKASGKFALMSGGASIPLGCYSPERFYMLSFDDSTYLRYGYVNWYTSSKKVDIGVPYEFVVDFSAGKQSLTIDGVVVASSSSTTTFNNNRNIYAFAYNNGGNAEDFSKIRFYSLKLYDNGTLVRDFVPAQRTSDGAVGLYDTVNAAFYTNAGTGTFTAGPTIAQPEHRTLIGGVVREVESETVLIGGVAREIESGTVLIGGVVREIEFS